MRVLFDTSVLVTAVVDQLPNHELAFNCLYSYSTNGNRGLCSTHAIAETYATLTAIPLGTRILPHEARTIILDGLVSILEIVSLDQVDYLVAVKMVSTLGLSSGAVYDALHLRCAEKEKCERIYTYNTEHFGRFGHP